MKTIHLNLLVVLCTIAAFNSCSSQKKLNDSIALYKTAEGQQKAYASYDSALTLLEVDFSEVYVPTDYGQCHILVSGEENKEPLFLLPGLFADATMWYPNIRALSQKYRVYTLDMMNYGGKSLPSDKAIENVADYTLWIQQIMDYYGIDRVSLAGLSYGSWLALALAREIPRQISSIILLDPSETFMPMNGGIAWKGFKYFMFFPNRTKYEKFFNWIGGGYTDAQQQIWFEHMLDVIEFGKTKMFDVPQHRTYTSTELLMLDMPVLIMAGGKPILYDDPEEFRRNALAAIPHADVVIVPDAGHGLNMEKPEFVNEQILVFLNQP